MARGSRRQPAAGPLQAVLPLPERPDSEPVPPPAAEESPGRPGPRKLRGLAAQRARAPIRETARTTYRPLFSKSVLNENPNRDLPFYWTINPYRGCEIGCVYCYARYTHEFMDHRDPADFSRKIYVKVDAPAVLREELKKRVLAGRPVTIGTATDPYQPAERRFQVTRRILETLSGQPGLDLSITTKSPLVLRDIGLLKRIHRHAPLKVNVSLITMSPRLSRLLDPGAPLPARRLRTIARLAEAGIDVNLFVMPILPGITDGRGEIEALLASAREAGAVGAYGNVLHLRGADRRSFWPVLRKHFPHLLGLYEDYYGSAPHPPDDYRRRISDLFGRIKKAAGFREGPAKVYEPLPGDQMNLGLSEESPPARQAVLEV